jgi:hypothetical protein
MLLRGRLIPLVILAILFAGLAAPASAHYRTSAGAAGGVVIPSLTHGQMQVIGANRSAILALADRQFATDETFQRLRNFVAMEFFSCLWGMVPGSITDEASPFNECSHAYLAATAALLDHMQGMRFAADEAMRLKDKIALEMAASGTASILCQYSGEPFNTAEIITPHWEQLPGHGPSVAFFGTLIACPGVASVPLLRRRRKPASTPS